MATFSAAESGWMARALRLAKRGMYTAHPNPRVGCVLVRGDKIVGEGWHRKAGEPHAEINALDGAGDEAKDCTAFITLEPCSHHGRTPPCADALIAAGVGAVVVAMEDPNPKVAGAGIERLQSAGIVVRTGLMRVPAAQLNEGFVSRVTRGRPFVRVKIAASLDGRTAMAGGESQWITGPDARRDVHRLRAGAGAVMTGVGTMLGDDPSLTVRDIPGQSESQPLRVILDSHLRTPSSARAFGLPGKTMVFCIDDSKRSSIQSAGTEVVRTRAAGGHVDPAAALKNLAELGVNDVLVEAGPALCGALFEASLVDELVIYQAPHMMGSETRGMLQTPAWQALDERLELDIKDVRKIGNDLRITARPKT